MKHLLTLLLTAATIFICGCDKSEKPKLVMVTNAEFPPYEYISNREIDGIDPAIIRKAAAKLGYELEMQNMPFDSVLAAVQTGKADIAASGITITEERKTQVNFTIPYVIAEQVVIVKKNSPLRSPVGLKGKNIGVQHGTTGDMYVAEKIAEPMRFSNGALAVAALLTNKVDAVVIDGEPAKVFVRQKPELEILPEPLVAEEYAFAVSKKSPELLAKLNAIIQEMRDSGEIAAIVEHYKALNDKTAADNQILSAGTFWGKLQNSFYLNFIKDNRYMYLWHGFLITLEITFLAVVMGIVIGFAVAIIRSAADQSGKLKFLNALCHIYLTVIRGTPVVVQLLIIYFVIFGSMNVDKVLVAVIAFGINSGAYVAEIIRSGIMAIDKGQMEAGRSLGLSYAQTMRGVILPQAFKNVLPALGNEFIVLLKETSIAGYIALQDLTKGGDIIRSQTYDAFLPLVAVAVIYLSVVMFLSWLLRILEKRLKQNE